MSRAVDLWVYLAASPLLWLTLTLVAYVVADRTGWWVLALAAGFAAAAIAGLLIQALILRHMQGQDLRQTMVTIGLSIVIADLLLWVFTGQVHQMEAPEWLQDRIQEDEAYFSFGDERPDEVLYLCGTLGWASGFFAEYLRTSTEPPWLWNFFTRPDTETL